MSRPTASQLKQPQFEDPITKIVLSFQQLQMVDETVFNQSYVIIKNPRTGSSWESPKFYFKMFDLWTVEVDGLNLQLQLYMKIKSKYPKVAYTNLHEGTDTIYLEKLTNPGNKFCIVSYSLNEVVEQPKQNKKNHFLNSTNIFDAFLNNNDISRVERDRQEQNKHQFEDERVAYFGEPSMISNAGQKTITKSAVKEPAANQNQNWHNQSSDQKRRFMHSFDDSVSFIEQFLKSFPENQQLNNTPQQPKVQQKQELSKIKENPNQSQQEYRTTSQKWYTQRFNKKNMKYRKKNSGSVKLADPKILPNTFKAIQITQFNTDFLQKDTTVRQMTDMSVEDQIRLKSIDFSLTSDGSVSRLCKLTRHDGNASSLWYTAISLPNQGTIMVQCLSEEGELNGCLGSEEIKKGRCPLYDDEGNIIGNFSFKCKSVSNYVVQTQDCLPESNESIQAPPPQENNAQLLKQKQQRENPQNKIDSGDKMEQDTNEKAKKQANQEQKIQEAPKNEDPSQSAQKQKEGQNKQQLPHAEQKKQQNLTIQLDEQSPQQKSTPQNPQSHQTIPQPHQQPHQQPLQSPQNQPQNPQKMQQKSPIDSAREILPPLSHFRKESLRQQKLQKTDAVFQLTIQNKKEEDDLKSVKKSVRESRAQRFETIGDDKKQNSSFGYAPTALPGASIKLETIDSKYEESYPLQVNSFSLQRPPADNHYLMPQTTQHNYMSSLSNRYKNPKVNQSHDSRFEYSSQLYDFNQPQPQTPLNPNPTHPYPQLPQKHRLDFKIENIQLILSKANYNGKLLKMQIDKHIYHTQTSKGLYILSWEGRGYFFRNVSEYSILYLEFVEELEGEQVVSGRCKIPLPELNTHRVNQVFQVEDFIRDENEEQVGRIKIQYKIIDRTQRNSKNKQQQSSSISKSYNFIQNSQILPRQHSTNPPKKKNRQTHNTHRISTENSSRANDSFQKRDHHRRLSYLENKNQDVYSVLSRMRNKSPVSRRKYTGGNTLIPKASRFVDQRINRKFKYDDPGPGQYEVVSSFDRHATPL